MHERTSRSMTPKLSRRASVTSEAGSVESGSSSTSRLRVRRKSLTYSADGDDSPSRTPRSAGTPVAGSGKKRRSAAPPKANKDGEYAVETIVDIQEMSNAPVFEIKWRGYSSKSNTWEPLQNIRTCNAINEFLQWQLESYVETINEIREELAATEQYQELVKLHETKSFKQILAD